MTPLDILPHIVVFAAALLQAATGIGFALMAGPVILIHMAGHEAVQVTMALSLAVCLILAPSLIREVDRGILKRLLIGTIAGLPIGLLVFRSVNLTALKALSMIAVAFMAFKVISASRNDAPRSETRGGVVDYLTGVLSGAMNTSLAMPGPAAASRLAALALPKKTVRATVLVLMAVSYTGALIAQAGTIGIEGPTLLMTARLLPATALGLLAGRLVVHHVSESLFRRVIATVLAATAVGLLLDVAASIV